MSHQQRALLYFCPLLEFLLISSAYALTTVEVSGESARTYMANHFELFIDEQAKIPFEQVYKLDDHHFVKPQIKRLNFGYTDAHFWLRFSLSNRNNEPAQALIDIDYPLLDRVTLYSPTYPADSAKPRYTKRQTGDTLPFSSRDIDIKALTFQLTLPANSSQVYYLNVATKGVMFIPIYLNTGGAYYEAIASYLELNILFYGAMIGLFLYNLFIAAGTRSLTTLYYCLLIVGNFGFAACLLQRSTFYKATHLDYAKLFLTLLAMRLSLPAAARSLLGSHQTT